MRGQMATAAEVRQALAAVQTESGANLLALTEESPMLLVFLRHFGCPFCRKAIEDVAGLRGELEVRGVRPVFVHLGTAEVAKATFEYYGAGELERVCDPEAAVYKHPVFGLSRVSPGRQMMSPAVWLAWAKGTVRKYGIGKVESDSHQMPGVFFLKGAKIVRKFIHRSMADQPDYLRMVA